MASQAWLIFNDEQKAEAEALNDSDARVEPRTIDNPMANQLGEGELLGKHVAPARLLNDPPYQRWNEFCSQLPIRTIDSDVLFMPAVEEA